MLRLDDLDVPIIAAPMAGGPSTPQLVAAVSAAGGVGLLAAGWRTADQMRTQIRDVRRATGATFGVNVFVPDARRTGTDADLDAYRGVLAPLAAELGVFLPEHVEHADDDWAAKLDVLAAERVPVVSFTFGVPNRAVIQRLHDAGTTVMITVTNEADARIAALAGADALCVQGPEAGGHRSTFDVAATPDERPLRTLLRAVKAAVAGDGAPELVAAGGLMGAGAIADALEVASAVQLGTMFLLADEAGTSPAYRQALNATTGVTRVTRAFSGRPSRGLENTFITRFDAFAPAAYPEVNFLTSPIRKASDDARWLSLWAGSGWQRARTGSAGQIVAELAHEVEALRAVTSPTS